MESEAFIQRHQLGSGLVAVETQIRSAEGPRLVSNLVDCAPEEIEIGMAVEVIFEKVAEDVWLPQFRKAVI